MGVRLLQSQVYRGEPRRSSAVNKVVIINREIVQGRITVVLVDEAIGF